MWQYRGQKRPEFAEEPGPGQESVWDYPRPPVLVRSEEKIRIGDASSPIASCDHALRVLETASPPTYYIPATAVNFDALRAIDSHSFCEWKGSASYYALADDTAGLPVAWRYRDPSDRFARIHDHLSFYPGRVPCYVDDERVQPQPGDFYGGWITSRIAGPVKGGPGTGHW